MLPAITGVVTLGGALLTIADKLLKLKEAKEKYAPVIDDTLKQLGQFGTMDLVSFTKVCRMEPLILLDDKLKFDEVTPDTLQVVTSLIAGYYVQTFALLGHIDGIDVVGTLDKLNPNRTGIGLNAFDAEHTKPGSAHLALSTIPLYNIGLEAFEEEVTAENGKKVQLKTDKSVIADIQAPTNLALGKMFIVNLSSNGNSIPIPVTVRVKPVTTTSDAIAAILSIGTTKNTVKERWTRFKAGELTFSNMWTGDDVIAQQKKILIEDTSGFYAEMLRRSKNNAKKGFMSGNPSLATDSNVIIVSETTALKAGRELGGTLNDFKIRESVFEHIHANILIVVDHNRNMVDFFYRGERLATSVTFGGLKTLNRGNGPDIMSIFTAFSENKIPGL